MREAKEERARIELGKSKEKRERGSEDEEEAHLEKTLL